MNLLGLGASMYIAGIMGLLMFIHIRKVDFRTFPRIKFVLLQVPVNTSTGKVPAKWRVARSTSLLLGVLVYGLLWEYCILPTKLYWSVEIPVALVLILAMFLLYGAVHDLESTWIPLGNSEASLVLAAAFCLISQNGTSPRLVIGLITFGAMTLWGFIQHKAETKVVSQCAETKAIDRRNEIKGTRAYLRWDSTAARVETELLPLDIIDYQPTAFTSTAIDSRMHGSADTFAISVIMLLMGPLLGGLALLSAILAFNVQTHVLKHQGYDFRYRKSSRMEFLPFALQGMGLAYLGLILAYTMYPQILHAFQLI